MEAQANDGDQSLGTPKTDTGLIFIFFSAFISRRHFSLYFLIADGIEMALDCEGDGGVTPSKPDKATQKWLSGNHPCSHKNVSFVHKSILREILCCDSAINVFLQVYLFYVLKIF